MCSYHGCGVTAVEGEACQDASVDSLISLVLVVSAVFSRSKLRYSMLEIRPRWRHLLGCNLLGRITSRQYYTALLCAASHHALRIRLIIQHLLQDAPPQLSTVSTIPYLPSFLLLLRLSWIAPEAKIQWLTQWLTQSVIQPKIVWRSDLRTPKTTNFQHVHLHCISALSFIS